MPVPLAPARTRLPDESGVDFSKPEDVKRYMASLTAAITVALQSRPTQFTARSVLPFIAPDGSAYDVSISNAGAWVITKRADPI